jgi:iron-sulfur cluster assembly protein
MIQLTELAAKKVKQQLDKRGCGQGIMIGVRTTGCSGLAYKLEYVDVPPVTRDWFKYESHNVTVWINGKDHPYINGLIMDYKRQGLNEGFEFVNPNERDRCGCGESFRV